MAKSMFHPSDRASRVIPCARNTAALPLFALLVMGQNSRADTLMPSPEFASSLTSKLHGYRSHAEIEGLDCRGFGGTFSSNDQTALPETVGDTLTRGASLEASWQAGVEQWSSLNVLIRAASPETPERLAAATGRIRHGTDSFEVEFLQQRRAIETILGDPTDLLQAWHGAGLSGAARVELGDDLDAEVLFDLRRDAMVQLDSLVAATDVRTAGYVYQSRLRWEIESLTTSLLISCETELLEQPQVLVGHDPEISLSEPRPIAVDRTVERHDRVRLAAGTYRLLVQFHRVNGAPQAMLNACDEELGAWAATDLGRLGITLLNGPDVDASGEVDFGDASLALLDFGPCADGNPLDLDQSGEVDFGDISIILLSFGDRTPDESLCQ